MGTTNYAGSTVGIIAESDGSFLALTFSASKNFKANAAAVRFLAKRGFAANGARLDTRVLCSDDMLREVAS